MKKHFKKQTILFLIVGYFLFGGLYPAHAASCLAFQPLEGTVNKQEVGAGEYTVVSIWDERGPVRLNADNSFSTVISTQRPQKISLIDAQKRMKALAVVVPGFTREIVFDARSTAMAVLLYDSEVFTQSQQVVALLARMEKSPGFQDLVAYLRKNMAGSSLESLSRKEEYSVLVANCQKEIFGEDQKKIMNSLQDAEKELEKVMR